MNEETGAVVLPDQGDILAIEDLTTTMDEVVVSVIQERPFLTTNFNEYSVTEGFLLLLLLAAFVAVCFKLLKGGFYWL